MSDTESSNDMDEFSSSGEESVNDRGDIEDDERDSEQEDDEEDVEEENDDDEEDDDAPPTEMRNAAKSNKSDDVIPKPEVRESKRKRRNRKAVQDAPEDDVLERAKQARLEREVIQTNRVKEFDDDDEDDENEGEVLSDFETPTKASAPIQVSVLSKLNPASMKKNAGAMQFAKFGLLGGKKVKRVSYIAMAAQKRRGPAVEFKRQKSH